MRKAKIIEANRAFNERMESMGNRIDGLYKMLQEQILQNALPYDIPYHHGRKPILKRENPDPYPWGGGLTPVKYYLVCSVCECSSPKMEKISDAITWWEKTFKE